MAIVKTNLPNLIGGGNSVNIGKYAWRKSKVSVTVSGQDGEFIPEWYRRGNLNPFVGVVAVFESIALTSSGDISVAGKMGAVSIASAENGQAVTNERYPYVLRLETNSDGTLKVYEVYSDVKNINGTMVTGRKVVSIHIGDFEEFVVSDDESAYPSGTKDEYYYEKI